MSEGRWTDIVTAAAKPLQGLRSAPTVLPSSPTKFKLWQVKHAAPSIVRLVWIARTVALRKADPDQFVELGKLLAIPWKSSNTN
jgi:hypothetical protein